MNLFADVRDEDDDAWQARVQLAFDFDSKQSAVVPRITIHEKVRGAMFAHVTVKSALVRLLDSVHTFLIVGGIKKALDYLAK